MLDLKKDLDYITSLNPKHISTYSLNIFSFNPLSYTTLYGSTVSVNVSIFEVLPLGLVAYTRIS